MHRIIGTRIHTASASACPDLSRLADWCKSVLEYADQVLIATDDQLFHPILQTVAPLGSQVRTLHVSPWRGFAVPLNAIVAEATSLGGKALLMQSFEIQVSPQAIEAMHAHLSSDTLVVGARLADDQGGSPGVKPIDGLTTPWNTLALWNLGKLHVTGFLGVSSGLLNGVPGGIEEVPTISLLQHIYPGNANAKLVTLPKVRWNTTWNDESRALYHYQKMLTKRERAEIQLKHLQVPRGVVTVL